MFGILAESLRTAVFGTRDLHRGDWPRSERGFRPRSPLDDEYRRNPHIPFRGTGGRG